MKCLKGIIIGLICLSICNTCKDFDNDPSILNNTYRIKTIVEINDLAKEIGRDVFHYEDEKLVTWQQLYMNENEDLQEGRKAEFEYHGNKVLVTLRLKKNNKWNQHQELNYTIANNLIQEKLISRYSFPACFECWKYNYKYLGLDLIESNRFIRDEYGEWKVTRKNIFTYKTNRLNEYQVFVNFDNTELKLDYKREYFYKGDKMVEWKGGTVIENNIWEPTEKTEYTYDQKIVSSSTFSVWDNINQSWLLCGTSNYIYDKHNNLIEKSTSFGTKTIYEYEKGNGNALLFYTELDEKVKTAQILKLSKLE